MPGARAVRTLGAGVLVVWLSVVVLLPLAALAASSWAGGPAGFWQAVSSEGSLAALRVTVLLSAVVAAVNVVMGTLIAWVLVR
ncbi:MAG: molybdate ABC transporter permease subunit, partial [Actinomycetota bacterium]|nr:molybdate ABC transporter permease subunit [Actinomycetota bacterium]